ncbi:MAG: EF-hand domain-containing protein [Planctomycetota bacterium]|nr:EF-hand domain-containing protein [Planctomycetota bacterium]
MRYALATVLALALPASMLSADPGQDAQAPPPNGSVDQRAAQQPPKRPLRGREERDRQNEGGGPAIGTTLPAQLQVHDPKGELVALSTLTNGQYTVIIGGCLTCPKYLRAYPDVEAIAKDYAPKDVRFYYLYKTLAHPENHGYVQPFVIEERIAQVQDAKKKLATNVPWLTDTMDNEIWAALGNRPNPHLILDGDGTVVAYEQWADGDKLRASLVKAIGPIESPTSARDLNLPRIDYVTDPASGVVERVRRSDTLTPILVRPDLTSAKKTPFYVKLRAEVTTSLLNKGNGELYLGFHVDPVHHVHWNNLVDPVTWEVSLPEGTTITPSKATGPKVKAATDIDPREFMVKVEDWSPGRSIPITVKYFACSDSEGWCKPVTQTYELVLQRDRSSGAVHGRSFNRGGGQQEANRGGGRGRAGRLPDFAQFDINDDGKLSKDELPERMAQRFDRFDSNGDGFIDEDEMATIRKRMQQRGGRGGQPREL